MTTQLMFVERKNQRVKRTHEETARGPEVEKNGLIVSAYFCPGDPTAMLSTHRLLTSDSYID